MMNEPNYGFKLECPKCGFKETDEEHFINTIEPCEDCGSHSAIACPECDERWEHVWGDYTCSVCGLIIPDEECQKHPDAEVISWRFELDRGS